MRIIYISKRIKIFWLETPENNKSLSYRQSVEKDFQITSISSTYCKCPLHSALV